MALHGQRARQGKWGEEGWGAGGLGGGGKEGAGGGGEEERKRGGLSLASTALGRPASPLIMMRCGLPGGPC